MEEGEAKKERHEEFQELQDVSHELQAQVQALKDELTDARSLSASLQQEARLARYIVPPASAAVIQMQLQMPVVGCCCCCTAVMTDAAAVALLLVAAVLLLLILLLLHCCCFCCGSGC